MNLHASLVKTVVLDLLIFIIIFLLAVYQNWSPYDLIWQMWISSLVVGAFSILIDSCKIFVSSQTKSLLLLCLAIMKALFIIFHFSFFHYVQGVLLSIILPPEELSFTFYKNFIPLPFELIRICLKEYYIFIGLSILAIHNPFEIKKQRIANSFLAPYFHVFRMHLLIFLYFIYLALNIQGYVLYLTLLLYFFPIEQLIFIWKSQRHH
jgi:hypothetical protein